MAHSYDVHNSGFGIFEYSYQSIIIDVRNRDCDVSGTKDTAGEHLEY